MPDYEDYGSDFVEEEDLDCKLLYPYYVNGQYEFHWANNHCNSNSYVVCEYPPFSGEE